MFRNIRKCCNKIHVILFLIDYLQNLNFNSKQKVNLFKKTAFVSNPQAGDLSSFGILRNA